MFYTDKEAFVLNFFYLVILNIHVDLTVVVYPLENMNV